MKNKIAFVGTWFTTLEAARKFAKEKGGRRIIFETDNGWLVIL